MSSRVVAVMQTPTMRMMMAAEKSRRVEKAFDQKLFTAGQHGEQHCRSLSS